MFVRSHLVPFTRFYLIPECTRADRNFERCSKTQTITKTGHHCCPQYYHCLCCDISPSLKTLFVNGERARGLARDIEFIYHIHICRDTQVTFPFDCAMMYIVMYLANHYKIYKTILYCNLDVRATFCECKCYGGGVCTEVVKSSL